MLDTMALKIGKQGIAGTSYPDGSLKTGAVVDDNSRNINIITAGRATGFRTVQARSVILGLGSRERTRGQVMLPGSRPAGIFTAGLVQRMVNIEGYLPGKEVVILGSGDIGLIMARRLTLEGCDVKGVYEIMPFSTGLLRNISQCLDDYDIPLYLSHTVSNITGNRRLESVEVCPVDRGFEPVASKVKKIRCDTLLLSVGLIPENELSKTCGIAIDEKTGGPFIDESFMTSHNGIFSCGNSLFIYDIVDGVTEDGYIAAQNAADYIDGKNIEDCPVEVMPGKNVVYVVPQKISGTKDVNFRIRVKYPLKNARLKVSELDFEKKLKHVIPGEMIFIDIKKEYFSGLNNLSNITFDMEE
jgi:thioredoxin reductase